MSLADPAAPVLIADELHYKFAYDIANRIAAVLALEYRIRSTRIDTRPSGTALRMIAMCHALAGYCLKQYRDYLKADNIDIAEAGRTADKAISQMNAQRGPDLLEEAVAAWYDACNKINRGDKQALDTEVDRGRFLTGGYQQALFADAIVARILRESGMNPKHVGETMRSECLKLFNIKRGGPEIMEDIGMVRGGERLD